MNAVIMDDVDVGDGCIIGALTFIKAGEIIPARKVLAGNPYKIIRDVSDEMLAWKSKGTALYQTLPAEMHRSFQVTEPLRSAPEIPYEQTKKYTTWKKQEGS